MASGVSVTPECKDEFQTMKLKHKYQYIIYRLNEKMTDIVVEHMAPKGATYESFVERLKEAEQNSQCRYAVFDAEYEVRGAKKSKLVFFYWGPDTCGIKQKMVYSASKEKFRSELGPGCSTFVQANADDDLLWESVMERLLANDKYM